MDVRFARENRRCSLVTVLRARVFANMNRLDTRIDGILVVTDEMMGKLQRYMVTLIRTSPRAACEEPVTLSVTDLTAASVAIPTSPGTRSLPSGEVASVLGETFMDLEVVPFEYVPLSTEAGDSSAIDKAAADLFSDVTPSHLSASHAVNASSAAGSEDDK